jgi:hypothetical protein
MYDIGAETADFADIFLTFPIGTVFAAINARGKSKMRLVPSFRSALIITGTAAALLIVGNLSAYGQDDYKQWESDQRARQQQWESDQRSRRQQARSDRESRRQQWESDQRSRRQQFFSDRNSRRQQYWSDRRSRRLKSRRYLRRIW